MKIEITPKLLAELKEKAGKATPGPYIAWKTDFTIHAPTQQHDFIKIPKSLNMDNNLAYLVAANPTAMLALIAKIEQLEKEADWLAERLNTICKHEVPDVCAMLDVTKCPFFQDGQILRKDEQIICKCEPTNWRNAAKEAIKANEQADK